MSFELDWRGDRIKEIVAEAARLGIDETTAAAVTPAKERTPVRTGTLQGSIQFRAARREGNRIVGSFGSYDVNYALWVEIGAKGRPGRHMLRQAADQEFPKLGERIKRHFEELTR